MLLQTTRPDRKWMKRLRENGFTARKQYNSSAGTKHTLALAQLKRRLLGIAGYAVILPNLETDVHKILHRGELFPFKYKMMTGEPSQCHRNSALLWEENKGVLDLCTGYALSKEGGIWRQHSWCFHASDNRVVETTVGRIAYFGFAMNNEESESFLYENE